MANARDCRRHAIVFFGAYWVELVIVTARTLHRQAEKRLAGRADDVFQLILPHDRFHGRALLSLADRIITARHEKTRCNDCCRIIRLHDIAGNL